MVKDLGRDTTDVDALSSSCCAFAAVNGSDATNDTAVVESAVSLWTGVLGSDERRDLLLVDVDVDVVVGTVDMCSVSMGVQGTGVAAAASFAVRCSNVPVAVAASGTEIAVACVPLSLTCSSALLLLDDLLLPLPLLLFFLLFRCDLGVAVASSATPLVGGCNTLPSLLLLVLLLRFFFLLCVAPSALPLSARLDNTEAELDLVILPSQVDLCDRRR
jgi:hypothetical protein